LLFGSRQWRKDNFNSPFPPLIDGGLVPSGWSANGKLRSADEPCPPTFPFGASYGRKWETLEDTRGFSRSEP
jgi:hypothetical protein